MTKDNRSGRCGRTDLAWPTLLLVWVAGGCGSENLTHPSTRAPYSADAPDPLPCVPNLDGTIDAREMAPTLEQSASYIVTPSLPVDTITGRAVDVTGAVGADGRRVWDWSRAEPSEQVGELIARPLGDQWYVSHFPGAQFALPSDMAGRLEGVYAHGASGLMLYGIASTEENPPEGQTLLVYETPVTFFPFPFTVGSAWSETGIVRNGTLQGLHPWSQDDVYEVEVDAAGELRLPDFTFEQALRVQTKVTIRPKAGSKEGYSQRQVSFVFECLGEVARASSLLIKPDDDDPGKEFKTALEVRKLGWF